MDRIMGYACQLGLSLLPRWFAVFWDMIQRPSRAKKFNVHTLLCPNVAILRIFPNISPAVVRAFVKDPIEGKHSLCTVLSTRHPFGDSEVARLANAFCYAGVVMQCYGAGNFPDENIELLEVLREACDRGVIIVNTTQCRRGTVSISYTGAKVSLIPLPTHRPLL